LRVKLGTVKTLNVLMPYDCLDNYDKSEPKYTVLIPEIQESDSAMRRCRQMEKAL
jgi:hypothetical protein